MYTAAVALAGVASATAFVAPSAFTGAQLTAAKTSSAMKMSWENELGVQKPLGFYDPWGLLDGRDAKNPEDQAYFERLRYVELKHGRICMLAVAGHLVQQNYRLPGMLSNSEGIAFADVPNGLAAWSKIPDAGKWQIFLFIGFLELFVMKNVPGVEAEFPGDLRNGALDFGWAKLGPNMQMRKRAIELNNGRAAMMGILALMVHEKLDGHPYMMNDALGFGYTFP